MINDQIAFLSLVHAGRNPGPATRKQDKIRQSCRKLGYARYSRKHHQWQLTMAGYMFLDRVKCLQS